MGDGIKNLEMEFNITFEDLKPSQFVQARYRCENLIGFSEYSDADYLLMAGVPQKPPKPSYMSSTDTTITVQLYESLYSNGAPITGYELFRDSGDHTSELTTKETSYDGSSMQFTVESLTPGVVYKIAVLAYNSEGSSDLSEYVMIAATELPVATAELYKDSELSDKTSLTVSWDKVTDPASPVTGYILQVADYGSIDFVTIFNGVN